MRRSPLVPLVVVAGVLAPGSASAATLSGTVVAEPAVRGATATVPVLLGEGSRRAAGLARPFAPVAVPARRGIRTPYAVLAPGGLRVGDRVRFTTRGTVTARRARTGLLRVTRRGSAPSFTVLAARRRAAATGAERTLASAQALLAGSTPGQGPEADARLRTDLIGLRTGLNLLIADLRTTADGFGAALEGIVAERPADPGRAASVAALQAPYLDGVRTSRVGFEGAADALDGAVATLDEQLNEVGGPSAPSTLPIGTVGTVSQVVRTVKDVVAGIELPVIPPTGARP